MSNLNPVPAWARTGGGPHRERGRPPAPRSDSVTALLEEAGPPDAERRAKQRPHEFSGRHAPVAIGMAAPKLLDRRRATRPDVTVQRRILDHSASSLPRWAPPCCSLRTTRPGGRARRAASRHAPAASSNLAPPWRSSTPAPLHQVRRALAGLGAHRVRPLRRGDRGQPTNSVGAGKARHPDAIIRRKPHHGI